MNPAPRNHELSNLCRACSILYYYVLIHSKDYATNFLHFTITTKATPKHKNPFHVVTKFTILVKATMLTITLYPVWLSRIEYFRRKMPFIYVTIMATHQHKNPSQWTRKLQILKFYMFIITFKSICLLYAEK